MKKLKLLFILLILSACSGTKRIVENTPKKTSEIQKEIKDTIIENIVIVKKETPDIINEEIKEEQIIDSLKVEAINHSDWNSLLKKHVSKNGNVNYKEFKINWKNLRDYIEYLSNHIPQENDTKEEKLAYWINAYNAFTIDLILRNYPIKSIKDIKDPWEQRLWKLDNKWYNLNEIEHQILRKINEPRIHFAIVCASYSCPKLQNEAFTASNLDAQLTRATKVFLNDSERNLISENSLELSKIFQWFAKDFKQNGSLIDFLNQYSDIKISDKAKKSFKDYNWDLNE